MFRAMQNVVPSHLADAALFDFKSVAAGMAYDGDGDTVFDKENFTDPAPGSEAVVDVDPDLSLDIVNINA